MAVWGGVGGCDWGGWCCSAAAVLFLFGEGGVDVIGVGGVALLLLCLLYCCCLGRGGGWWAVVVRGGLQCCACYAVAVLCSVLNYKFNII